MDLSFRKLIACSTLLISNVSVASDTSLENGLLTQQRTSPDHIVELDNSFRKKIAKVNDDVITFSEFYRGTKITDQYANRGIIFSGDSPYIVHDGSNRTSPVLSGSPQFEGAIEGHFVDPEDSSKTLPVSEFSLDAGYFNNLSSTRLQWFNEKGQLLGERYDSIYGIEHFNIKGNKIARWRIEIISQEDAGFAIDNVSFTQPKNAFNYLFQLDKVTHLAGASSSNAFSIYFDELESKDPQQSPIDEICLNHRFKVKSYAQTLQGDCTVYPEKAAFRVDFRLPAPYTLENAETSICSNDRCEQIKSLEKLSVYGTAFNVKQHGYLFRNGGWRDKILNNGVFCWETNSCQKDALTITKDLSAIAQGLRPLLPQSKQKEAYQILGFQGWGGTCLGMSTSAVAQFNNRSYTSAWGSQGTTGLSASVFTDLYKNHFQNISSDSPKPLPKQINQYKTSSPSDIAQSVSQIAYHHASQPYFQGGKAGVGSLSYDRLDSLSALTSHFKKFFKQGMVTPFNFKIKKWWELNGNSGHSIIATQLIEYNDEAILVLHDNNFPSMYSQLALKDSWFGFSANTFIILASSSSQQANKFDVLGDFIKLDIYDGKYVNFRGVTADPLLFYGNNSQPKLRKLSADIEQPDPVTSYNKTHIVVSIQGAGPITVIDTATNKPIVLRPTMNTLDSNSAYIEKNGIIQNLYLPTTGVYELAFTKYAQLPELNLYVHTPIQETSKVRVVNYIGIQADETEATKALVRIESNKVHAVKRDGNTDVEPSYVGEHPIYIEPINDLSGYVRNNNVQLNWSLPDTNSLEEVIIVRNSRSMPKSLMDGVQIYRGLDSNYLDTSTYKDRIYYYGIFAIGKDGQTSEVQNLNINTHQAGIAGSITDTDSNGIRGVEVTLYNAAGLDEELVDSVYTDTTGHFAINGLPHGTYKLVYNHPDYVFPQAEKHITLTEALLEVNNSVVGRKQLSLSSQPFIFQGKDLTVTWSDRNLSEQDTLSLHIKRINGWEQIATSIAPSTGQFSWTENSIPGTALIVRISLDSDPEISSETQVVVVDKSGKTTSDGENTDNDHGNGGSIGMMSLFCLILTGWLRRRTRV